MKRYYFLIAGIAVLIFGGFLVFAASEEDIVYPVPELGNCKDESGCRAYCDSPDNMEVCLDFAGKHNLISDEELAMARKMLATGQTLGPGGCRGQAECGDYCDDISHIKECVAFAEKNGLMSGRELEEAKKVAQAFEKGITPPNNCRSKEECDTYCMQPANMKECITFAKEAGLIPPEELEEVEKVLAAIDKGVTPPPCGNKDACDSYCSEPEHFEECITFAEAAGFMSSEEAAMVRRTGGQGPGGCRGKDECESFCEDPANMGPCVDFAVENGFMSPEEAEQARKMMAAGFTAGPGGCKGGEECQAFCEDPTNMETCIGFAVQMGDMTPEEAEQAIQGMGQMQEMESKMRECVAMPCSEALDCFQSAQGEQGEVQQPEGDQERGAGGGFNAEIQAKIESCVQEMQPPEGMMPSDGMMPPGGEMPIYDESQGGPAPFIPEGPSQEEIDRMMEEETQRKMQQIMEEEQQRIMQGEIDRMMEQQSAPPTGEQPPQSFFNQVKNFLAGLISR